MLAPMSKLITVVGAVLVRDGVVFAVQRGPGRALEGKWEFPGGKVEPGEDPREALTREIREELGCDVTVGEFLTTTEYEYDFGTVILSTYYCTLAAGEPQLSEHTDSVWLRPGALPDLDWAPADIPAVALIAGA